MFCISLIPPTNLSGHQRLRVLGARPKAVLGPGEKLTSWTCCVKIAAVAILPGATWPGRSHPNNVSSQPNNGLEKQTAESSISSSAKDIWNNNIYEVNLQLSEPPSCHGLEQPLGSWLECSRLHGGPWGPYLQCDVWSRNANTPMSQIGGGMSWQKFLLKLNGSSLLEHMVEHIFYGGAPLIYDQLGVVHKARMNPQRSTILFISCWPIIRAGSFYSDRSSVLDDHPKKHQFWTVASHLGMGGHRNVSSKTPVVDVLKNLRGTAMPWR